ncbi:MAG TPA: polysaccharide deacetylase family protein, partial [Methylococcales bacterium]
WDSTIGTGDVSINSDGDNFDEPEPHMNWKQVEALIAGGVTVASHGWTHRSLGKMSLDEARDEAVRSKAVLEQKLGFTVSAFAYPFGTLADFNEPIATVLRGVGYQLAFTSQHGAVQSSRNQQPNDPLLLPRVKVEGGEGLWMFRLLAHGGLDNWRLIDQTLWWIQQSPEGSL